MCSTLSLFTLDSIHWILRYTQYTVYPMHFIHWIHLIHRIHLTHSIHLTHWVHSVHWIYLLHWIHPKHWIYLTHSIHLAHWVHSVHWIHLIHLYTRYTGSHNSYIASFTKICLVIISDDREVGNPCSKDLPTTTHCRGWQTRVHTCSSFVEDHSFFACWKDSGKPSN